MEMRSEVVIGRPIADVFAGWAQIERFAEWWDPVVERRKLTDGPVAVGTQYAAVDRMPLGWRIESTLEITGFETNERIAGRLTGGASGVTWEARFEQPKGGTRFSLHTIAEPLGLKGILLRLMGGWFRRIDGQALERFKASQEAQRQTP